MIEGVHTCRNFSRIQQWSWDRALDMPDIDRHVEDGHTVTFFKAPDSEGPSPDDASWSAPEGWNYTVDDL